jgi:hypothetical protein
LLSRLSLFNFNKLQTAESEGLAEAIERAGSAADAAE